MVVDKVFIGTLSTTTSSLHHYKMSGVSTKQPSTSKSLNSSALDICMEIEKKMDKFFEEFKVAITRINERLDVLQFQVNCLANGISVNPDQSLLSASLPDDDTFNIDVLHSSTFSQQHTYLVYLLLSEEL